MGMDGTGSYRSRRWRAAKSATRDRLGQRSGVIGTVAVPVISALVAFWLAGAVTGTAVVTAIVAAVVGVAIWGFAILAYSWIVAPGEMAVQDAQGHRETAQQLAALQESLRPRFQLAPESVNEVRGVRPAMAILTVECLGNAQARNCRARLVSLGSDRFRRSLDIPLAWAQPDDPADPSRKTFYGSARLNVVRGGYNPNYMLPAYAQPLDVIDQQSARIARDHENLVCVEVSADDMPPLLEWFRLRWFSYIVIRDKESGQDTMYDLHDDQIVFVPESESTRKPGVGDDEYS